MRKSVFAAVFAVMTGLAGAQEVKLLEDIPAEPESARAVQAGDEPQIIMPSEEKPAAEVKPAPEPAKPAAPKKTVKAAVKKAAKKPVAEAAKPAPAPAAVKPAEKSAPAAAKPSEKAAPAAAPVKPAPAAVKPVEKTAAANPAPAVKAAAPKVAPAAKPAQKTPEPVKPAASPVQPPPVPATAEPVRKPEAPAGFVVPKTHTVSNGDTLWDLSNKYYSDPFKWGRIYNANLGVVSNPDRIYPKNELIIPDLTEELRPEVAKPVVITGGETVKEADLSSVEIEQPAEEAPAYTAPRPAAPAAAELKEALAAYDRNDLSEEMPEHQKEWASGVKIVPESWREDGVIKARETGEDDSMEDSLSLSGAMVRVAMSGSSTVKRGDRLTVYLKGSDAFDNNGKKLGREVQRAGTLEVVEADGANVRARVIDSVTGIYKGYVVKKK